MRRALGMSSAAVDTETFASLISKCPADRDFCVYIRKSNATAEAMNANYLMAQMDIYMLLVSVGVPETRIIKLQDDTGKSGALSRQYRTDLQRVFEGMGTEQVGTVVAIDVARLFRDYTDKNPAEFASRASLRNVQIVTQVNGEWTRLDMSQDADNMRFRDLARAAATERKSIRARTMSARERMVLDGGYSGSPVPVGWGVQPKQSRHESADGKEHAGHLFVYEPHATVKKEIMRLSLRADIRSLRGLRDLLVRRGVKLPPFEPQIAIHSFSRSVISRAKLNENGVARQVTRADAFVPSLQTLKGLLLEPLALGDRLYGSGKYGQWKARRLEREAKEQDQRSDHMLREYREFVGHAPELAICATEEEVEMFFRVAEKWSTVDMRAARDAKYLVETKNEACIRKVGRVMGSGHKQFNEWAGKVFCAKHGVDENGHFLHDHYLRRVPQRGEWICSKAYDAGEGEARCASWGDDDRLARILDFHLYHVIHNKLQQDDTLVASVIEERQSLRRHADDLRTQVGQLDLERRRQMQRQDDLERRLERMDEAFRREQIDRFFDENVAPIMVRLAERQRQLREAEESGLADISEQSEEEIRRDLETLVLDAGSLSDDKKRELVHTFVDRVDVLVPDHTGECLIHFHWSPALVNGRGQSVTDTLIAPKPLSKDFRPFTPEEDEFLQELYPAASKATYAQIKERLLPGRKIDAVIRRVYELGIRRPLRSKEWIDACRKSERTWGQQHTNVLYVCVPDMQLPPSPRLLKHDAEGEWAWNVEADEAMDGIGHQRLPDLPYEIRRDLQVHAKHWCPKTPSSPRQPR